MTASKFEIRPIAGGFQVFSITAGAWGNGSGLASTTVFPSEAKAMAWVTEQFRIAAASWSRQSGVLVAQG